MICGIKPDDEGLSGRRGNVIQARASVVMLSGMRGLPIPLEGFKHKYRSSRLNMKTVNRIAKETGTEVFSIVVMLVPKRPYGYGWRDPVCGDVDIRQGEIDV